MAIKLCQGFDSNLVLQEDIKMSAFKVHNKTARWELGITNLYGSLVVEDFFVLPDASKEEMEEAAKDFESFTAKLKALKLTSDQKDQVLENAIITSKSPDLIEAAKVWNGDRKASLFNRSAKLQTLEKQLVNEAISSLNCQKSLFSFLDKRIKNLIYFYLSQFLFLESKIVNLY